MNIWIIKGKSTFTSESYRYLTGLTERYDKRTFSPDYSKNRCRAIKFLTKEHAQCILKIMQTPFYGEYYEWKAIRLMSKKVNNKPPQHADTPDATQEIQSERPK